MLNEPSFLKAVGERYGDFVVTKYTLVPELNCLVRELTHLPSRAQVMHIGNDDPENLFCLSFKTLPSSSNGAAHILEHTVLCGSKKFPVKDPFFAMSRRSLHTFMNALTGSDFTCYPAASQVEKDFYNLLEVYLDAVFHPELKELSFLQEGHRLSFTQPTDPTTPLQHNGIVFNEMKGSLASAEARLWHAIMQHLMPNLPYAFNSGGDPKEIPNLTYEELLHFHSTYYHPSRCLFFFYGNFSLKKHLDFIEESLAVPAAPPIPPIPKQPRFTAPLRYTTYYPVSESESLEQRSFVSFGWLTASLLEQEEILALSLLDAILMESDASPLKNALLESGWCVQADAYIDTEMSEVPYVIVCKGCNPDHAGALELLLIDTLKKIASEPISQMLIDAALHQLELSRLEINGEHAPFGLTLFMRSALAKQHGCDPEHALRIHSLFEDLLKKVKDPSYLPALITRYFIQNPHRVRVDMHPDPRLSEKESAEEKQALQKIQTELTPPQIQKILLQTEELTAYQKKTETQSLDCLPKVSLEDVSPIARDIPIKQFRHGNLHIVHHDGFTNHFLYADLLFDLPNVTDEDLPYVHLLISLLPELGSGPRDYLANLEYMQAHTGGIGATCALHTQADNPKAANPCINIRGKALYRKAEPLFTLMRDMTLQPHYHDKKRIRELLIQFRDHLRQRLNKQGMRYAVQLSLSGSSTTAHIGEAWFGLRYYQTIEKICADLDHRLPNLIDRLIELKERLFTYQNLHLILTCEKSFLDNMLIPNNFYGLNTLPAHLHSPPWRGDFSLQPVSSQMRIIASQVAFCAEGFKTISYIHPFAPALLLSTLLIDHKILHPKIREQGGAYGCGATYNSSSGHFYFHSYRDPHIAKTWNIFHQAMDEISAGHFSEQDLEEAKLGIIQQLDSPISPGHRALTAYGLLRDGKNFQMRQAFRTRLLEMTSKEIQHVLTTELLPKKNQGIFVAFTGQELAQAENTQMTPSGKALPIFSIL